MKYGYILKFFSLLIFLSPLNLGLLANEIKRLDNFNEDIQKNVYLLGPGDQILINFIGADELSGLYQIMSDGNIQFPLIGTQNLSGLTLNKAQEKLVMLFSDELIRPEISLKMVSMRPLRVSLIGEVYRPGVYSLNVSENSIVEGTSRSIPSMGFPTVVEAIQKAGGLTLDADIEQVTLYRKLNNKNENIKKAKLDLLDLIQTGDQTNNPNLFDGDVIKIPKLNDLKKSIADIPNNLTPEKINIYVVGQVENPGMYKVSANTTVSKAILIAGGPLDWRYQKNNIKLLRVKRDGEVKVKKVKFNQSNTVVKSKNTSLRNGDIVQVNKNLFGKSTDALGTFLPPIRDLYSLYGVYKIID